MSERIEGRWVPPWQPIYDAIGVKHFTEIRNALIRDDVRPFDRDAFLLHTAVAPVYRELVPEDGPAEAVNAYGTLLHFMYLQFNTPCFGIVNSDKLRENLRVARSCLGQHEGHFHCYFELPPRLVWSEPEKDAPHEPIDGLFLLRGTKLLRTLALLGIRDGREGFTALEADTVLPYEAAAQRDDGTPHFTGVLPGGERLISIVSHDELLLLADSCGVSIADDDAFFG